jgi:hypothetical protein
VIHGGSGFVEDLECEFHLFAPKVGIGGGLQM